MIRGETIVCFAPDPWSDIWRNRHQIMTRLAKANRVIYVEPRPYLRQALRGPVGGPWSSAVRREAGLWVYRPPRYAPIVGRPPIRAAMQALRAADLRRLLRRLDAGRPIVWLFRPDQDDVPGQLGEKLCIYHIVDDYSGYVGAAHERRAAVLARERALMARADLVFVTSAALLADRQEGNPHTFWVPNGVDADAFRDAAKRGRPPLDLVAIPEPHIGYVGAVNDKLDFALLRQVAEAHPEWSFVFVGPWGVREDADADRFRALSNVRCLGARSAGLVPKYVAGMQVGLLPYKQNEWTRHIDPLKMYEYLAAGIPVVATDIPGVRGRGDWAILAEGEDAFAQGIAAALGDRSTERSAERRAAMLGHTWDSRVADLSEHVARRLAELDGAESASDKASPVVSGADAVEAHGSKHGR